MRDKIVVNYRRRYASVESDFQVRARKIAHEAEPEDVTLLEFVVSDVNAFSISNK